MREQRRANKKKKLELLENPPSIKQIKESNPEIEFVPEDPKETEGCRSNSVALFTAMTGSQVIMARSQFRRFNSDDAKIFIGDNEGIFDDSMTLFKQEKYKRHTVIPDPRYSPFLNAWESS